VIDEAPEAAVRDNRIGVGLALFLVGCSVRNLPPPPTPDRIAPAVPVPAEPPPPGKGRVVIGIVGDEPSLVQTLTGRMYGVTSRADVVSGDVYTTVCSTTPCVADLDLGTHDVTITSTTNPTHTGAGTITAGPQPSVYRYALGRDEPHVGRLIGGINAVVWGGIVIGGCAIGLGVEGNRNGGVDPGVVAALVTGLVVGGGLAVLGTYLLAQPAGEQQSGTGVQWVPGAP
jgi:hypothetical protein